MNATSKPPISGARARILDSAYTLISRKGVRGVGVDEIIAASGVAKATFYKHFPSKNHLVLAVLDQRAERWTRQTLGAEARARGHSPDGQLLAMLDLVEESFRSAEDHTVRTFIHIMLEMGPDHPVGAAVVEHLRSQRELLEDVALEAGFIRPTEFAQEWQVILNGCIVAASEGNDGAIAACKRMASKLLSEHRPG